MTVQELIEALQAIEDQNKEVYICNSYDGGASPMATVRVVNYGIRIDA